VSGDFALQNHILIEVRLPPAIVLFETAALSTTQGNYRYFPPENPKMLHIFGGHPRTGVPTV
jgi:hypothetical protein